MTTISPETADGSLASPTPSGSFWQIFIVFLRLGCTSFGGPIAHLSYFRQEIVLHRQWIDETSYADLVGLCQALPGPTSSQVGIALGMARGGWRGGLAAWIGFTMPSAALMIGLGYGAADLPGGSHALWLRVVLIIAVAVVAQAVWGMATSLCPDRTRRTMALVAAGVALLLPGSLTQVAIILLAGLLGWALLRAPGAVGISMLPVQISRSVAVAALALFVVLLIGLPLTMVGITSYPFHLFASFYQAGALVFGGGHVVLPLLQQVAYLLAG